MLKDIKNLMGQKGSMMVEALAMLGLISMVTPVLYKKSAERTTELQDINTATQMRTLSKALDDFIQNNYVELSQQADPSVSISDIEDYLPYGFNTTDSKMFSGYNFAIQKSGDANYPTLTGIVTANIRDPNTPAIRTAKIASMIGANGGVVRGNEVQGVQGGWSATVADLGGTAADGDIVAISSNAVTASSGVSSEEVLYRTSSRGKAYNTMSTSIYMADNPIEEINKLIVSAASAGGEGLVIGTGTDAANPANLTVKGAASVVQKITGTGGVDVSNGAILLKGNAESELSTSTGNLKVTSTAGKLDMAGQTADLKATGGALTMSGSTTANLEAKGGKLTLSGSSNASLAATSGDLTMSGAASATTSSGAAKLTLTNSGSTAQLEGAATTVSGTTSAITQSGNAKLTLTSTGATAQLEGTTTTVKGGTGQIKVTNSNIAITGNTAITGNATVSGSGTISGDFYANNSNLKSTNGGTTITAAGNQGTVKTYATGGLGTDNIYITNNAYINGKLVVNNLDVNDTFRAGVSNTSQTLKVNKSSFLAKTNDFAVQTTGGADRIKSDSSSAQIGTDSQNIKISFGNSNTSTITANSGNLEITADKLVFANNTDALTTAVADSPTLPSDQKQGVSIYRQGIIQLPRTQSSTYETGYIKADRLVANAVDGLTELNPYAAHKTSGTIGTYPTGTGDGTGTSFPSGMYDQYQINPAYTSVMHDIKLTTRGGARLSDILPDFINKGIYVLDNTYKENNLGWDGITVHANGTIENAPSDCGVDANCITSPWMGFIPAPQCPPGYAKVVTIHPIRWKMADVLSVSPGSYSSVTDAIQNTLKNNFTYDNFNSTFLTVTDPDLATYDTSETTAAADTAHKHILNGAPLNYQINTWLNTTVSGTIGGTGNLSSFLGWHGLMGFLYSGSMYQEYLSALGTNTSTTNGKIVWNLFPVYYQELSAVADTYCYFERDTAYVGWQNSNLIDTSYDQILHYRSGYNAKPSGYVNRLNDPNLKYKDPW